MAAESQGFSDFEEKIGPKKVTKTPLKLHFLHPDRATLSPGTLFVTSVAIFVTRNGKKKLAFFKDLLKIQRLNQCGTPIAI